MPHHILFFYTPLPTEICFRGAILQSPRLHFCKSQQNNLKQKKLGNPFSYKLHLCQVLPCCREQIVTSHFSSLCFVPQLDKRFCKCSKTGSNPCRQTHTSLTCRAGCGELSTQGTARPKNAEWNLGIPDSSALRPLLSTQMSGIRGRRCEVIKLHAFCCCCYPGIQKFSMH